MKIRSQLQNASRRAFTFLEIMLVVTIIGILLAVVGPNLFGRAEKAKVTAAKAQMDSIKTALQHFEIDVGRFPTGQEGLKALVERPSDVFEDEWDGPYLQEGKLPKDPWKQEFTYKCPPEHSRYYDLYSLGKDRQEGTDDDITNWEKEGGTTN
ncbi:MAG: type II secretion system major pseudopilin GspG [bacterium]